ncbi:hypothetical protein VFPBJ_02418 [Purpureocillium lilacinum]|uniref:Uncharacterized protein n=1 Tax=Purpureocillium lilacinum TaxID=33203 RepID=A0A179H270_PURLI|nr:hypothetical protein VFPBJ_02418 [Purpureocillium lilacinum]
MAVKQQTQDSPHERKRTPDGVCNTARMDGSAESCAAAQNFLRRAEHHCDMHCRLGIVHSSRPFSGTGQARPPPVTKMHVKEFVSVCRLTPEPHPRNRHDDNLDQRIRGSGNRHQQRGAGCGLAWSWVPTPDYRRGSEMNLQGERGLLCRTSMKKSHGVRAPAAFIIKCNLMRNLETPYHCKLPHHPRHATMGVRRTDASLGTALGEDGRGGGRGKGGCRCAVQCASSRAE